MQFEIHKKCNSGLARTGVIKLKHGDIETPAFMPVGTNATVKAMHHSILKDMGVKIILANTYHLYLRPGIEVIKKYGSLHEFSSWDGNILTDSGGFQVFSLAPFRKIKDEGVYFRSHIDGSYHTLTPKKVIELQHAFKSDILMPLDVCTPPNIEYKKAIDALEITTKWAKRSINYWKSQEEIGALFCIIQGNFYKDLRKRSTEELLALDFPGIAIGGLSVGEEFNEFVDYLSFTSALLPEDKPHYVMGIGTPEYILEAVNNGIDIFDCVFPTRIARNGTVFTKEGTIPLKKARFEYDNSPIEDDCGCNVCRKYTKGYLRHLFKAKEILGPMLASEHNIYFLHTFMKNIRNSINNGSFPDFKKEFLSTYKGKNNG